MSDRPQAWRQQDIEEARELIKSQASRLDTASSQAKQATRTVEEIRRMFNIHPDTPHDAIVDMARETFKYYAMEMARRGGRK